MTCLLNFKITVSFVFFFLLQYIEKTCVFFPNTQFQLKGNCTIRLLVIFRPEGGGRLNISHTKKPNPVIWLPKLCNPSWVVEVDIQRDGDIQRAMWWGFPTRRRPIGIGWWAFQPSARQSSLRSGSSVYTRDFANRRSGTTQKLGDRRPSRTPPGDFSNVSAATLRGRSVSPGPGRTDGEIRSRTAGGRTSPAQMATALSFENFGASYARTPRPSLPHAIRRAPDSGASSAAPHSSGGVGGARHLPKEPHKIMRGPQIFGV